MNRKKVLLGMSGGTDSSVAAMLLQEQGYDVTGITFRFYEIDENTAYLSEAAELAARLGIPHYIYDARAEFEKNIVAYFIDEYMSGRTPVPCIVCNNTFKWPLMAKVADEQGIRHIATGHYVRLMEAGGHSYLQSGVDLDKDQSFFLWGLPEILIKRMILPLGTLTKTEVREIARQRGFFQIAARKDSLGVCFCPGDYRSFLKKRLGESVFSEGFYEDESGKIIGKHKGYPFYTVGQRRGLGFNLQHPVFVKEISVQDNRVVIAPLSGMYKIRMILKSVNVIDSSDFDGRCAITCRIRYRKQNTPCRVFFISDNQAEVRFDELVHSVAPGQAAAFFCGDRLLGGGIYV